MWLFLYLAVLVLCAPMAQAQTAGWIFPSTSSYGATSADNGKILSTENVPGATITVALPSPSVVGQGWLMGFSEAGSHGVIANAPVSVFILTGQKTMTSFTMPSNINYEYFALQSDGTNFRILTATQATARFNGIFGTAGGQQWQYLFSTGYSATLTDNGSNLSSQLASGPVTIILPSTGLLPNGWSFTAYTGGNNSITLQPNGVSGGTLVDPLGHSVATYTIPGQPTANHAVVSFDGGSFRIEAGGRLTQDTGVASGNYFRNQGAVIDRLGDRVFIGKNSNVNAGLYPSADWLETIVSNSTSLSQLEVLAQSSGIAVTGAARTSDSNGTWAFGVSGFCFADNVSVFADCWGMYAEANRRVGIPSNSQAIGIEADPIEWNSGGSTHMLPYMTGPQLQAASMSAGFWSGSGGGRGKGNNPTSLGLGLINAGSPFLTGIWMGSGSVASLPVFGGFYHVSEAMALPGDFSINWYEAATDTVSTFITSIMTTAANPISLVFQDNGTTTLTALGGPNFFNVQAGSSANSLIQVLANAGGSAELVFQANGNPLQDFTIGNSAAGLTIFDTSTGLFPLVINSGNIALGEVSHNVNLPNIPAASTGGGLSICIDNNFHLYKKLSCP